MKSIGNQKEKFNNRSIFNELLNFGKFWFFGLEREILFEDYFS